MAQTRSMTLFTAALGVTVATVLTLARDARGHVAPSVDDNNRYLKLTPMRSGVRLAYTVFFGEIPGASERKKLDGNRDGRIDAAEAKRFGDGLAAQVAASLELDLAGARSRIQWAVVDVGLGTPSVAAGAFSVDMIAYLCVPGGSLRLRDQFRIPRPGETEVLIEDTPGVTIRVARIGAVHDPRRDWRFLGQGGPLSDDGLELAWTATDKAPPLPSGACAASARAGSSPSRLPFVVGALVIVCVGVGGVLVARKARARPRG